MDFIRNGWFSEVNDLWSGISLSLEVKSILYEGKSDYQDIKILDTNKFGRVLILDGVIQCCEFDEFVYQEMISFLPLYSHENPQKVLIVGGGDGGVAREVSKHPSVREVSLVEIDQKVIDVCKIHLPDMAEGLSHPKVKLFVEDGFKFMEKHSNEFDIIITDSSDPVGPSMALFEKRYYELMKGALKPGGIICCQAGSPWTDLDMISKTCNLCKEIFPIVSFAITSVPTYTTGQIGFILASLNTETNFRLPRKTLTKEDLAKLKLRYYTSDVHLASFLLPKFVDDALSGNTPVEDATG